MARPDEAAVPREMLQDRFLSIRECDGVRTRNAGLARSSHRDGAFLAARRNEADRARMREAMAPKTECLFIVPTWTLPLSASSPHPNQ